MKIKPNLPLIVEYNGISHIGRQFGRYLTRPLSKTQNPLFRITAGRYASHYDISNFQKTVEILQISFRKINMLQNSFS